MGSWLGLSSSSSNLSLTNDTIRVNNDLVFGGDSSITLDLTNLTLNVGASSTLGGSLIVLGLDEDAFVNVTSIPLWTSESFVLSSFSSIQVGNKTSCVTIYNSTYDPPSITFR